MIKESYNLVICEDDNQAYDIRLIYKKQSQIKALKIPRIETLDIWLAEEYQNYLMVENNKIKLSLLNGIEEKILWEKIITSDLKIRKESAVTDITNLAQQAINANRIISTHHIKEVELEQNAVYKELKYFLEWRKDFKKKCSETNLITKYDFINFFTNLQKNNKIINDEKILFISIDEKKKSHEALFKELSKSNIIENQLNKKFPKVKIINNAYQSYEHEVSAIIEWIKENISKKHKKLLIISPALERFQIKIQNEIDRHIQPIVFNKIQTESIANFSLRRPLSAEPILRSALNLIKLNDKKFIPINDICELLLFNNWIDNESFLLREDLANTLRLSKKKFISLQNLQNIVEGYSERYEDSSCRGLRDSLNLIQKNQEIWREKSTGLYWSKQIFQYLDRLNFSKVNNLLYFENNNLKFFFKVINYVNSSKVIPRKLTLSEYLEFIEYYLENFIPSQPNDDAFIDIYGFYENPTKKYDAIWLMNMNDNFWPNKDGFNPFLSKNIQSKYNLFNNTYYRNIYFRKIERLSNITSQISISHALKDNDSLLSPSPWNNLDISIHKHTKIKSTSLLKNQYFIDDHQAPAIKLSGEIFIKSGRLCLENQTKCPAWAFYSHRLGCSTYEADDQDEVSKSAEGLLIHRVLELFWSQTKSLDKLLSMNDLNLEKVIEGYIAQALKEFEEDHSEIDSRLLLMQQQNLKNQIYTWLSEEKKRPLFQIKDLEKTVEIKINRIRFNIRIDRIDVIQNKYELIVDYKTGKNPTTRKAFFSDTLTDLQIPIYACFLPNKNLAGVAIAHINRRKINLYGITSSKIENITPQLNNKIDHPVAKDWSGLLSMWQQRLEKTAEQYLSGNASVTFNKNTDFTYCEVLPLLRLAEKKYQFEQYK